MRPAAALPSGKRGRYCFYPRSRVPGLYGAVNKRFLSTGETGELVLENVGFDLNPGVELAPQRRLLSNWRNRPACKNVRNVADTGAAGNRRCCQDNERGDLVRGRCGSPKTRVSNYLSAP